MHFEEFFVAEILRVGCHHLKGFLVESHSSWKIESYDLVNIYY